MPSFVFKYFTLLILGICFQSASAATYSYGFSSGSSDFERSLIFSSQPQSPLSVEARAGRILNDGTFEMGKQVIRQKAGSGLGVCGRGLRPSTVERKCIGKQPGVDGGKRRDMLILDFGTNVTIESLSFGEIGKPYVKCLNRGCTKTRTFTSSFQLYTLSSIGWEMLLDRTTASPFVSLPEYDPSAIFGIVARRGFDSFYVAGAQVSTDNPYAAPNAMLPRPLPIPPQPSDVPLPASAMSLIAAFLLLAGAVGLRRSA
ncbi:hypothetical protein AB1M95_04805 [Sulfitobacter sp. LCG007]